MPEEPRGAEPLALVEQAADAVARVAAAGWLRPGGTVAEYGSPHGGSWLSLLEGRGMSPARPAQPADVVLDCFGMMHSADQAAALAERAERVTEDGVLLIQFHSLATILRDGQWNALRHGHYAYYSIAALTRRLADVGFTPVDAWQFELYGGTVLLAATRAGFDVQSPSISDLMDAEQRLGVEDPERIRALQHRAASMAANIHSWLVRQRISGVTVYGYGAASRAVALLCRAGVDRDLLPAIADASHAKQGRRMPGTDVPVISPHELIEAQPAAVLVFLPDLLSEVRHALPQVEAAGGQWVDVVTLGSSERA